MDTGKGATRRECIAVWLAATRFSSGLGDRLFTLVNQQFGIHLDAPEPRPRPHVAPPSASTDSLDVSRRRMAGSSHQAPDALYRLLYDRAPPPTRSTMTFPSRDQLQRVHVERCGAFERGGCLYIIGVILDTRVSLQRCRSRHACPLPTHFFLSEFATSCPRATQIPLDCRHIGKGALETRGCPSSLSTTGLLRSAQSCR